MHDEEVNIDTFAVQPTSDDHFDVKIDYYDDPKPNAER